MHTPLLVCSHWNSTLKRRKNEFLPLRPDIQQFLATASISMRGADAGGAAQAAPAAASLPNAAQINALAMATLLQQQQQQMPQLQQQQGALAAAALAAAILQQQQKQQPQSPSAAEVEKLNQLLGPLTAQLQAAGTPTGFHMITMSAIG
jgi:hypothetical protein